MYVPFRDGVLRVASLGGVPRNRVWYHNVAKHPEIAVTRRGRRMTLRACLATPEEMPGLWPICDPHYANCADYRKRTGRDRPIFACEPEPRAAVRSSPCQSRQARFIMGPLTLNGGTRA